MTPQEEQQSQQSLNPCGLPEIESPTEEQAQTVLRPLYIPDEQLGLHAGFPATGAELFMSLLTACLWILCPPMDCLVWPQWDKMHLVLQLLDVCRDGGIVASDISKEKGKMDWGKDFCEGVLEGAGDVK